MDVLMDGLLTAATLFAGGYCWVLARRVRDLKSLDRGLGGAIVTLTRQVELARTTLEEAQSSSRETRRELGQLIDRADSATAALKLSLAGVGRTAPRTTVAEAAGPVLAASEDARPAAAALPRVPAPGRAENSELPKPRSLPPIGNPLRRREPIAPIRSEDELMEALSAMAGGAAA